MTEEATQLAPPGEIATGSTDGEELAKPWIQGPLPGPWDYSPRLHAFALVTAAATLFLLFVGGLVTTTSSGDAVPDWWFLPFSYGELFPEMTGGIFYEHGHRLVATAVGILTLIMAFWVYGTQHRPGLRFLVGLAVGMVVFQGTLGGVRVLLPEYAVPVAIAHALIAQAFFCVVVTLVVITSRRWLASGAPPADPAIRKLAMAAIHMCFIQILLGAILRHTGSGLVLHFIGAGLVAILAGWTAVRAQSIRVFLALLAQLGLGFGAWWFVFMRGFERSIVADKLPVWVVTGHLPVGALLLGTLLTVLIWNSGKRLPIQVPA